MIIISGTADFVGGITANQARSGRAGHDSLMGSGCLGDDGRDGVFAGAGSDTVVTAATDTIYENINEGIHLIQTDIVFQSVGARESLRYAGAEYSEGFGKGFGSSGDNFLIAGMSDNRVGAVTE